MTKDNAHTHIFDLMGLLKIKELVTFELLFASYYYE